MSFNFPWKTIQTLKPYEIATSNYYKPLLNDMIEYKISEYEVENLPPSYIINFISVLQYFCQNKKLETVIFQNPNKDKNKDNKIFELELKVEDLEMENQSKDNIILEYEKIVKSLQNNLSNAKNSFRSKLNSYKNRIRENKEKENENKLEQIRLLIENKFGNNYNYSYYPSPPLNDYEYNDRLKSKKKSKNKEEDKDNKKLETERSFQKKKKN